MGTPLRCYVCDIETSKRVRKSIFDIKSQHSKKPIAELLERFQNGVGAIQARDGAHTCVLCDDCIDLINTYDEAYMLAEHAEKKLRGMLARTEKYYESAKDAMEILITEQVKAKPMPKEPVMRPDDVAVAEDPFDEDEMHIDRTSEFEHGNDTDAVNTPEPEEDIESEEGEIDSDDSFVWPKIVAPIRRRDKEEATEPDIYRCIECPADFRDKYEMQVVRAINLRSSHCVEKNNNFHELVSASFSIA